MKKITDKLEDTKKKINSINYEAHWYRRVFHAFGASFLCYYMLPDVDLINLIKFWVPLLIIIFAVLLESFRLKGIISSDHFFALRAYEKNRAGSYLFFGVAVLILLLFFPQQIAISCILCGCFADPIIGESRFRFGKKWAGVIGFLICIIIFMISFYKADIWIIFLVSIVGSSGAVIGEMKKFWWIDDDFMIQILPAVLVLIILFVLTNIGIDFSFQQIIFPGDMPW